MDGPYSSGEEPILKARKPYTITKQRERWTEEEHNRFLEALKLYGRAWQRIEEHIGTKTAVQIRSHAQKFFTKLEKEANFKGIPVGQALDIEIPPPRPKRKPSIPYPRKLGNTHLTSPVGSRNEKSGTSVSYAPLAKDTLDLKSEILPEIAGDEKFESETINQEENTSGRSCVLQVHPGTLSSSVNKNPFAASGSRKPCAFKEFVPNLEEVVNSDEVSETYDTTEASYRMSLDMVDINKSFQEKNGADDTGLTNPLSKKENCSQDNISAWDEAKLKDNVQKVPSQPRHVPVNVVDSSLGRDAPLVTPHMASYHEPIMHPSDGAHPKTFIDRSASVNSEHCTSTSNATINQPVPCFHPLFPPTRSQDEYQSLIHASSTFSNLLVSALLQNPAAHAAATFAARFWPHTSMEATACNSGGFPAGSMNAVPSMAAIAAATVASATAWWAAHGLLPLCMPYQMGLSYAPSSASPLEVNLARAHENERSKEANDPTSESQQIRPELSEALQGQHLSLKFPESEESDALKSSHGMTVIETDQGRIDPEVHDSDKLKGRKQVDRSSCGSNSSSEVDTDGLEKQEKIKEEVGAPALSHPASDAARRARSSSCSSDSWKEVSKEGRLAFQALFSRQVLPQSFSPQDDSKDEGESMTEINQQSANGIDDERSKFCLNSKIWLTCSGNQEVEQNAYRRVESSNKEEALLATRKSKVRCTGFKPYKRCSSEAKESWGLSANGSQDQEKCPKRVRLEGGEASA